MATDLRRQTINDLTNAMLSSRRLARALRENPRFPHLADEETAARKLSNAADEMETARAELETATTQ